MKVFVEEKTKRVLLDDVNRQKVSQSVRRHAIEVINHMSGKLLKSKRRKALLFIVLNAAYINAGELKRVEELARELNLRGKMHSLTQRANLVQFNECKDHTRPLMKSVYITTAAEILEERARKIATMNDEHIQAMQRQLKLVCAKNTAISQNYPQKVAASLLCIYAEANKIIIPECIENDKTHKITRAIKQALI